MLLKLIKYDLKATYARIMLTFATFTILCIIAPAVLVLIKGPAALLYSSIVVSLGIMALYILTLVFLFQRYHSNFYSSEGYLMFTLPTNGRKLLASKLITALIWTLIASVLMAASLGVMLYVFSYDPTVATKISTVFADLNINFSMITCFIVSFVIGIVYCFLEIYFAISVSKLPLWRKFGVLMGFVTFFAVNLIESIPGWLNNGTRDFTNGYRAGLIYSSNGKYSDLSLAKTISTAFSWNNEWSDILVVIIASVALFLATSYLLDKKTSLK